MTPVRMATDMLLKRVFCALPSLLTRQLTRLASLDNLFARYEEPSSMARWDSPLFTVLWTEEYPPTSQIWAAITQGNVKSPNSGTLAVCMNM